MLVIEKITVSELNALETTEDHIVIKKLKIDTTNFNLPVLTKKLIIKSAKYDDNIFNNISNYIDHKFSPIKLNGYGAGKDEANFLNKYIKYRPFECEIILKGAVYKYII